MAETIGERIKAKREELNLTQSQVAEKLFVTQQTVARWEGNKHLPPITALQDLGKLFKVDTSYFFGGEKVIVHKFNLFAFFGSVVFNLLFFWLIAVVIVTFLGTLWAFLGGSLISPIVFFYQVIQHIHVFELTRLIAAISMSLLAIAVLPIWWKINVYLWRILKAYYRYNVNSIFYEIAPHDIDK